MWMKKKCCVFFFCKSFLLFSGSYDPFTALNHSIILLSTLTHSSFLSFHRKYFFYARDAQKGWKCKERRIGSFVRIENNLFASLLWRRFPRNLSILPIMPFILANIDNWTMIFKDFYCHVVICCCCWSLSFRCMMWMSNWITDLIQFRLIFSNDDEI